MTLKFNRKDKDGKVIAAGTVPGPMEFEALKKRGFPGEYVLGDEPVPSLPKPDLPAPVRDPDMVSLEELADAVIKLAAGDKGAVDDIAAKRKRTLTKAAERESDKRHPAQRFAGRNKAASKRRVPVQSAD